MTITIDEALYAFCARWYQLHIYAQEWFALTYHIAITVNIYVRNLRYSHVLMLL